MGRSAPTRHVTDGRTTGTEWNTNRPCVPDPVKGSHAMMPHDHAHHSEGTPVGDLVPGPWTPPQPQPTPAVPATPQITAPQPQATAPMPQPSTDVEHVKPRQAGPTRVLRASQVAVGRARQLATSPTTRDRTRRITAALKNEVLLIGQGVHMVCRRSTLEGQLRHYYEGNNPNGKVRADQIAEYRRERKELKAERRERWAIRTAGYAAAGAGVVAEGGWLASLVGVLPSGHVALDLTMLGINAAAAVKLRSEGKRLRAETAGVIEQRAAAGDVHATTADDIAAILRDAGVLPSSTTTAAEIGLSLLAPPSALPEGQGWEVRVMLPSGVVVGKIKKRIAELASALDTSPAKLTITKVDDSEARARIRVWSDYPMSGMGAPSPLVTAPRWDLTTGVPLGRDIDGHPITLDLLAGMHGLMCAGSGGGKTATARLVALAAVLDPTAELHVIDGKPDGAWSPFRELCATYREVLDEDEISDAADALEGIVSHLKARMERRARGEDVGGMAVVIVDEFQELTGKLSGQGMKPDQPRPRVRAALERISRLGRSAGVRLILATQQFDGQTLDAGTEASLLWRWVGKVPNRDMSRAALGDAAAAFGIDANRDIVAGEQVGVGYLVAPGVGTVPPLVKSDWASDEDVTGVCARVLAEKAGTAPAAAPVVDEHQERDDEDVLDVEIDREADLMETLATWLINEHVSDDTGLPTSTLWAEVVQPYAASVWPGKEGKELPTFVRSMRGFGDWLAENGVPKIEGKTPKRRAGDIYAAAARMVGGNVTEAGDQPFPGDLRAVR